MVPFLQWFWSDTTDSSAATAMEELTKHRIAAILDFAKVGRLIVWARLFIHLAGSPPGT